MNLCAEIFGWIGNIGFIVGAIALAKKTRCGFYWQILGNVMYVAQGFILGISSITTISLILIVINVCGILNWRKK